MKPSEYDAWLAKFESVFPTVAEWIAKQDNGAAIARNWREVLMQHDVNDLDGALGFLKLDDSAAPNGFQNDRWPQFLNRMAHEARARRTPPEHTEGPTPARHAYQQPKALQGLAGATVEYRERMAKGDTPEQLEALLKKRFPDSEKDGRYGCLKCLDTGTVWVWGKVAVDYLKQGGADKELPSRLQIASVVACECFRGDAKADERRRNPLPRYSPEHFCRCPYGNTGSARNQSDLRDWVSALPDRYRTTAFDEFNQKGALA